MNNLKTNNFDSWSEKNVRQFLLKKGFYPESFILPPFFESSLDELTLKEINWKNKKIEIPIDKSVISFRVHDANPYGWRTFSLIHPWHYWHIVNEITKKKDWELLKNFFQKKRKIVSYSIPVFYGNRSENGIKKWIKMENDILAESFKFSYLLRVDVKRFYQSIYTHSIVWALHGKPESQSKPRDFSMIGNRLDKLLRSSNGGQTNGIFVGPLTSEFISEIILLAVDDEFKSKMGSNIDYEGYRFRDDYRFLCKTKYDCENIIRSLDSAFRTYNLEINNDKTEIFSNVTEGIVRPWLKDIAKIISSIQVSKTKKTINNLDIVMAQLIETQKKYFKGNILMTFIGKMKNEQLSFYDLILNENFNKNSVKKLISQLISLADINKSNFSDVILIISKLMRFHFKNDVEKREILLSLEQKAVQKVDIYELIWIIYLIKYNNLYDKKTEKLLTKESEQFKNEESYRLLLSIIENNEPIFSDIGDLQGRKKKKYVINKEIVEQYKNNIVEENQLFKILS